MEALTPTPIKPRQRVLMRHADLLQERNPRMQDWLDLNDYELPRRMRYLQTDKRKRTRNTKVINGTPARAVHILESGMMAGMTNPARPWLRVMADRELMQITRVSQWCGMATPKVLQTFIRSNLYRCLPKYYGMGAVFGTASLYVQRDPIDVVRGFVLPTGQYACANDERGRVRTHTREFTMSVLNVVEEFGWENVSSVVKQQYNTRKYDEDVVVIHLVEPRKTRDPDKADYLNMPYASYWLEKDAPESAGFLRIGGYRRFPFFVFRWDVTDDQNDAYGDGPGIDALGDSIGLQLLERRKAQAVDKVANPPMTGPSSAKVTNTSFVPGGYTPSDAIQSGQQVRPSQEINHAAPKVIGEEIAAVATRIKEIFYNDLWLMMTSSDRREITAREVDERHEEKMIQLGPVVDRLNDELIDPLVEFIIAELIELGPENGGLPPPPPELAGQNIRVDNISILAQAQKLVGTVGLERLAGFAGNIAAVDKGILDNIDRDQLVRNYADMLGIDPSNLTDREKMAMDRMARQRMEQEARMAEAAQPLKQGAEAAKVLSETDVSGDTALSRLLGSIGARSL
jgi:hypothetical protein